MTKNYIKRPKISSKLLKNDTKRHQNEADTGKSQIDIAETSTLG